MSVRRTGQGARVVWIHGLGESSLSFESSVSSLPGYAHVLVDLPGCGRSPWPDVAPSIEEVADLLARWLEEDPPAVLVGHSLGGVIATLVAERTSVRGVVDIDGNITEGDCSFSARAAAYALDDFVARGLALFRDEILAMAATRPELRAYHAALSFASPAVFHRHARELVDMSGTNTLAVRLAALDVPVVFIAGVPDGICADSVAELHQHGVSVAALEPAGHWVYLDQPAAFTATMEAFLSAALA